MTALLCLLLLVLAGSVAVYALLLYVFDRIRGEVMPKLWPGGETCECPTCGRFFSTTSNFDRHREGPFDGERRCLDAAEMTAKGMFEKAGVWKQVVRGTPVYGETVASVATNESE